jgi:DNA-binding MarR family transcriptional regulator
VREQHPGDGRSSVVSLTPRGKSLYEKAFQLHHDPIEETMGVLTAHERAKLVDILVRLGDSFAESRNRQKKRKSR